MTSLASESTKSPHKCPKCSHNNCADHGSVRGTHRLKCKRCAHTFLIKGRRVRQGLLKWQAMLIYAVTGSYRHTAEKLNVSHTTVRRWLTPSGKRGKRLLPILQKDPNKGKQAAETIIKEVMEREHKELLEELRKLKPFFPRSLSRCKQEKTRLEFSFSHAPRLLRRFGKDEAQQEQSKGYPLGVKTYVKMLCLFHPSCNKSELARAFGIRRATLYKWIKQPVGDEKLLYDRLVELGRFPMLAHEGAYLLDIVYEAVQAHRAYWNRHNTT
jgi:transposase-like protein